MRLILWLTNNLKTVALSLLIGAVVFMLGFCTGIANAQTWNLESFSDPCIDTAGIPIETHQPLIGKENARWHQITQDGNFRINAVGIGCTDLDAVNTDHYAVIDTGYSDYKYQTLIAWNSGLAGVVFRNDGTNYHDGINTVFAWYDNGVPIWNVGQLVNGSFTLLGNLACNTGGAGGTILFNVQVDGPTMYMSVFCTISGFADNTWVLANDALLTGTYIGYMSRNGAGNNVYQGFSQLAKVLPTPEPEPVDFTPFFYIAGIVAALVLTGFGEYRQEGTYLYLSAFILLASVVLVGVVWLTVTLGIGGWILLLFRAAWLDGWIEKYRNRNEPD